MRMINKIVSSALLLLMVQAGTATSVSDRPRMTFFGLGEISIGMTQAEAEKLGFKDTEPATWDKIGDEDYISCHHLSGSPEYPGIWLMVNDGIVTRMETEYGAKSGDWFSHSGASQGMTEAQLTAIYGKWLEKKRHPYLEDQGSYLILTSRDGKYRMIFETAAENAKDEKRVTQFRAGFSGPVGYIEGCA